MIIKNCGLRIIDFGFKSEITNQKSEMKKIVNTRPHEASAYQQFNQRGRTIP